MDEKLISKKDLLNLEQISYGTLYRWKRQGLIPESWFIHKATEIGQATFFPEEKILARIDRIREPSVGARRLRFPAEYTFEQRTEILGIPLCLTISWRFGFVACAAVGFIAALIWGLYMTHAVRTSGYVFRPTVGVEAKKVSTGDEALPLGPIIAATGMLPEKSSVV